MEILRGMEVKIRGVIHRLIFFKKKKYFIYFFLGGGHICANYWGGHGPPCPPIPTALKCHSMHYSIYISQHLCNVFHFNQVFNFITLSWVKDQNFKNPEL